MILHVRMSVRSKTECMNYKRAAISCAFVFNSIDNHRSYKNAWSQHRYGVRIRTGIVKTGDKTHGKLRYCVEGGPNRLPYFLGKVSLASWLFPIVPLQSASSDYPLLSWHFLTVSLQSSAFDFSLSAWPGSSRL